MNWAPFDASFGAVTIVSCGCRLRSERAFDCRSRSLCVESGALAASTTPRSFGSALGKKKKKWKKRKKKKRRRKTKKKKRRRKKKKTCGVVSRCQICSNIL